MFLANIIDSSLFWIILWIAVLIITLIVEFATEQLISIWFSGGSLIALILAICNVPWYIQLMVFALVSVVFVLLTQFLLLKKKKNQSELKTNADSLIGNKILVLTKVSPENLGEGKYRDIIWSLQSTDLIEANEYAEIIKIEGNRLIVKKIEKGE